MQWYIDAWAAVDGRAFASWRAAEIPGGDVGRPGAGVFLAAPHFEPEWTTSPTTALAATRGLFQWGFYDSQNKEIPFETLEELREFVRRVYIAGGGGGQGPDATVSPEPVSPTADDQAVLPEELGGSEGEEDAAKAFSEGLAEPDLVQRREHITDAVHKYLQRARRNQFLRFVADVLVLAARHPDPRIVNVDVFREWGLSVATWALFFAIIAQDRTAAVALLQQARNRSPHSTMYDWVMDSIEDMLTSPHHPYFHGYFGGPYCSAERKAPLLTLPRFLPLPSKQRFELPRWVANVGDSVSVLGASYRRTFTLARGGNVALIAGSGAAMVLCSLLAVTDFPFVGLPNILLGDEMYLEDIFRQIATWTGENTPGPELEHNNLAIEALEKFLEYDVGTYHLTP